MEHKQAENEIHLNPHFDENRLLKAIESEQKKAVEKAKIMLQNAAEFKSDFESNSILQDIQNYYEFTSK